MFVTNSFMLSSADWSGLMTMSKPGCTGSRSKSVMTTATSTSSSTSRSRPVISQSIQTRRSFAVAMSSILFPPRVPPVRAAASSHPCPTVSARSASGRNAAVVLRRHPDVPSARPGREPHAVQATARRPVATPAGRPAPPGGRPSPRLPRRSRPLPPPHHEWAKCRGRPADGPRYSARSPTAPCGRGSARPRPAERAKCRGCPAGAPGCFARSSATRAACSAGDRLEARGDPGRPTRASRRQLSTPPAARFWPAPCERAKCRTRSAVEAGHFARSRVERATGGERAPRGRTNGRNAGVPTGDTPAFRPFVEKWGRGKAPTARLGD